MTAGTDPLKPPPGYGGRKADALRLAERHPRPLDPLQRIMGLPAPQWLNNDDGRRPDGLCVMMPGLLRCAKPATHQVWIGCTTGEHLDKSSMCEAHALDISQWKAVLHCQRCWDALAIVSDARIIRIETIGS